MTKYQQYFQDMLKQNKALFESFKEVHDNYANDPQKWKEEFNNQGRKVKDIIYRYENRLCSQSEGTGHGKFTTSLSDKFWGEVRATFPKIDAVGII